MNELCNRLRAERARLNLSQEELAVFGGVKRNTQSLYEKGERIPDANYLTGITKAGADVLYILTGTRAGDPELKPEEAALLDNYRHASADGQRAIETTSALLSQQGAAKQGASKKGKVA